MEGIKVEAWEGEKVQGTREIYSQSATDIVAVADGLLTAAVRPDCAKRI